LAIKRPLGRCLGSVAIVKIRLLSWRAYAGGGRDVCYWLGVTTYIDYSQTRKGVSPAVTRVTSWRAKTTLHWHT